MGKTDFSGKIGVVSARKERGVKIFSCVFIGKNEAAGFVERLKEVGKFVKVL